MCDLTGNGKQSAKSIENQADLDHSRRTFIDTTVADAHNYTNGNVTREEPINNCTAIAKYVPATLTAAHSEISITSKAVPKQSNTKRKGLTTARPAKSAQTAAWPARRGRRRSAVSRISEAPSTERVSEKTQSEDNNKQKPPGRCRKLSSIEFDVLMTYFKSNPQPSQAERIRIAEKLQISYEKIKNWFQNRRAKMRKDSSTGPCLEFNTVRERRHASIRIYPACNDLYRRRKPQQP